MVRARRREGIPRNELRNNWPEEEHPNSTDAPNEKRERKKKDSKQESRAPPPFFLPSNWAPTNCAAINAEILGSVEAVGDNTKGKMMMN